MAAPSQESNKGGGLKGTVQGVVVIPPELVVDAGCARSVSVHVELLGLTLEVSFSACDLVGGAPTAAVEVIVGSVVGVTGGGGVSFRSSAGGSVDSSEAGTTR